MKNKWFRWILVLGVITALALPKLMKKKDPSMAGGKGPGGQSGPVPVKGEVVRSQTLSNTLHATGTLLANEEVELQCEASGKVTAIYFEEGKPVRKGQLLLKINDAELQAALKKAESRMKLATDMERRQKELLKKEGISEAEYDLSRNDLNAAGAELAQLKEQIRKTEIVAPFDGNIGLKYISEGAFVTPSSRIASLQNVSSIKIEFAIPEQYISRIHNNTRIRFTTPGTDKVYEAIVYALEPKIDLQTRNITLRARCMNDGKLFPGSFASVEVILDDIKNALLVPTEAIVPVLKGQKVYVIKTDSIVEQKVETGIRTSNLIQIKSGLSAGDTIAITALMQLKKGSKVKIMGVK